MFQATETPQEIEKTNEKVFEDRKFQVDAAIVRIMKSKKKSSFKELSCDVYESVKFPFENSDFKKCIESLIERDYIVRDKDESSLYHYVA